LRRRHDGGSRVRQQQATPSLTVASPGRALVATVATGGPAQRAVTLSGREILRPSRIALTLQGGRVLGANPAVTGSSTRQVDQVLHPVVRIKRAEIRDRFTECRIDFAGGYSLLVRAYDDGVAYRFVTKLAGEITIESEDVTFAFPDDFTVWFPEEASLLSHQERLYKRLKISEITEGRFSSLPALVEFPDGPKVAITEADLFDYPGMDLTSGPEAASLKGLFPAYPLKVELRRDRDEGVVERAGYIARTRGTREFPWRVLVVAERDADLLSTDIVYRLAAETTMSDTSWIRPGKVAWDWWNHNNIYGVPFKAGINTDTYKHYIDFAAENGIEYVILDEDVRLGDSSPSRRTWTSTRWRRTRSRRMSG
jgi:alpha-glucosidase